MPIEKKKVTEVSNGIRNVYHKAQDVIAKCSYDYGIELLKEILKKEPGFLDARKFLRKTEHDLLSRKSGFAKQMSNLKLLIPVMKGYTKMGKHPEEALALAEDALAYNVRSPLALGLLRDAGKALGAGFIVMEALEGIVENDEKNEANIKALADVCEAEGAGQRVLQLRQKIAAKHPDSLEAQAALRAAAALATIEQQNEITGGKFKSVAAQKKKGASEDDVLLRDDRIVRSEEDIRKVLEHYKKLVENGDESIDNRRKMAEYYMRIEMYPEAIEAYNWITGKLGTLDPNIDKAIEKCNVAMNEKKIAELEAANAPAEEIDAIRQTIASYRLERGEERVKSYPNDTLLRFELAVIYWDRGEVEKALEQFQLAQRNPQKRLYAFVYLGRCFAAKNQYDMAIEQFDKALAELPVMDALKMDALYYQGVTLEAVGESAKAMDCFKQIYSVNVNFKDVSKRMDAFYAAQNAKRKADSSASA